jgi:hypothetical protein
VKEDADFAAMGKREGKWIHNPDVPLIIKILAGKISAKSRLLDL